MVPFLPLYRLDSNSAPIAISLCEDQGAKRGIYAYLGVREYWPPRLDWPNWRHGCAGRVQVVGSIEGRRAQKGRVGARPG